MRNRGKARVKSIGMNSRTEKAKVLQSAATG